MEHAAGETEPAPGDRVRVERDGVTDEGVLMPSSDEERLVLKLDGGYNVGVDREPATVEVVDADVYDVGTTESEPGTRSEIDFETELPRIALISTGGTIASTVDYRTGAVTAQFDAEDVLRAVPDLAGRANYCGRVVANILSENMEPPIWQELADCVAEEIERGADGVVVMHGTDTMQYSAAALSFVLDTPVPVVFTGSQRSADRPSSDNVVNAVCAVEAAKSDCAEVLVCMHADESDDGCALHRGTRVRKNHTSRRDAFETVGGDPLGRVDYEPGEVTVRLREDVAYDSREFDLGSGIEVEREETSSRSVSTEPALNPNVELVKFTPGMDPAALDYLDGTDGVVIEGTGLGHVHTDLIPRFAELVDDGTTVVMTSQCLEGRVCDRVYDTGRDLLDAGVIEAGDTLPGTAKVKLMWALANCDDEASVAELMRRDLAGELTEESQPWR
jgi:glutamyl-tRNA(Gln) amidotransferase subunit D